MGIPNWQRVRSMGVDSPLPTQVVSNEEILPRPQHAKRKEWAVDAFKRFQISDERCEKFGYKKLTKPDKQLIFGLNAARSCGIDVEKERRRLDGDDRTRIRAPYRGEGLQPDNNAHWRVRAD